MTEGMVITALSCVFSLAIVVGWVVVAGRVSRGDARRRMIEWAEANGYPEMADRARKRAALDWPERWRR